MATTPDGDKLALALIQGLVTASRLKSMQACVIELHSISAAVNQACYNPAQNRLTRTINENKVILY